MCELRSRSKETREGEDVSPLYTDTWMAFAEVIAARELATRARSCIVSMVALR